MSDAALPIPIRAAARGRASDLAFRIATAGSAWLVLLLLAGVTVAMAWGGREALATFGPRFLASTEWNVVDGRFGALVPIYGTIATSAIALVIAVPVSIGIALFLTDIAPRWSRGPIGIAIELLAAIPSIIYGMWGLFVFAPFMAIHVEPWLIDHLGHAPLIGPLFSGPPIGIGLLSAGIVLGIMITPFLAAVARDVFNAVPQALRACGHVAATDHGHRWLQRRAPRCAALPRATPYRQQLTCRDQTLRSCFARPHRGRG